MMWLFMYPWFRHTYHWFAEIPYYWFYVDTHISLYKILVNDMIGFYSSILNYMFHNVETLSFNMTDFINWQITSLTGDCNVFIKSTIRELVLKNLI